MRPKFKIFWGAAGAVGVLLILVSFVLVRLVPSGSGRVIFNAGTPTVPVTRVEPDLAPPPVLHRGEPSAGSVRKFRAQRSAAVSSDRPQPPDRPAARPILTPGSTATVAKIDNAPQTLEELDQTFEQFLMAEGHSTDDLDRQRSFPVSVNQTQLPSPAEAKTDLEVEAAEILMDWYPIEDVRLQASGEVWIQIDSSTANPASLDEMMAATAAQYGNAGQPVKVVAWSGNRTRAVKTFFGEPIF